MKITPTLFVALSFSAVNLFATGGSIFSNQPRNEVRYIKDNKRMPDVAFQQELRQKSNWKNFLTSNGTWYVVFNEENQKPHRAFGKPIPIFGIDAQSKALNFITTKLSGFNIPVADLSYVSTATSEHFNYVHFYQNYHGIKVLNSDLYVKLTQSGNVISFGCDVFNDITISTTPSISAAAAKTAAESGLVDVITSSVVNSELFVLPVPEFKQNVYKLVYEVTVETIDQNNIPSKFYTLVNAENGEVIYRVDKVMHYAPPAPPANTDITISGTVYPTQPYNPSAVMPLRNLKMVEGTTTYYSDSLGYYGLTNTTPTTVNFTLEGKWSKVFTGSTTPSYSASVNPGTNTLSFDANANIKELSAYYHVNIVHDYMKSKFPTFTGMDNALPTNIDVAGTCNAFYNGTSINFYAVGGGCNSLAQVGDVVYHEYGHGINDKVYASMGGSFSNGAMGEGYADVWALGITGNAVLGYGFDSADPNVFVRRYDINKKVYPQDLVGEVHADGEIIAGAWWDTGLNFGNLQQMMNLFKETYNALISGADGTEGQLYVDVLIEALTDDDVPSNGGDNDITNGTPNDNAIVDAFDLHGITLLSNANVIHTPIETSVANTGIPVNASVSVMYPWALVNVKLFYKLNRLGAWTGTNMTNTSGTNYTATIPAQPMGTVIGYYIGLEASNGNLSAVQPAGANLANPNIPYYILNGVSLLRMEDFDDNMFGSWTAGITGDDATTGVWVIDVPTGSYYTPGDLSSVVQPGDQHTPAGMFCAVTGNAPSTTSALGTNDVDGGETTLESPVYDLSTYTNPIFSYYRWYINNPPSGANPANDYWEVQISNDNVNWVKIERTNVSDKSWRKYAFRVTDYVPVSSTVKLRFVAEDSVIVGANLNGGSLVEAGIDDVFLYEEYAVGVNENEIISSVSVYPNPALNELNLIYTLTNSEDVKVEITNSLGQVVQSQRYNDQAAARHNLKLDVSDLVNGVYFVSIKTSEQNHIEKVTIIK